MGEEETPTVTIVGSKATLKFLVDVGDGFGHAVRQTGTGKDMAYTAGRH